MIINKDKILDLFLCLLSLGFLFLIFKRSYRIEDVDYINLIINFSLGAIIFYLYNSLSKNHKLNFLIGIVAILIIIIIFFNNSLDNFFLEKVIFNLRKINESIGMGEVTYYEDYKYILTLIGPLIVIFILTLFKYLLMDIIIYINLSSMMFLYYIGYSEVLKDVIVYFIFINLCLLGINEFKINIKGLRKNHIKISINKKSVVINIITCSMIIALIVNLMPLHREGKYEKEIVKKASKTLKGTEGNGGEIGEAYYGLSYSGYSNTSKKLGGPINISNKEILEVESEIGGLYLRGSVKDLYLGDRWDSSFKILKKFDTNKKLMNNNYSYYKDFLNKKSIKVYPKSDEIISMFAPLYSFNGDLPKNTLYASKYDLFYNEDIKEYSFDYYEEERIKSHIRNASNSMSSSSMNMDYLDISNLPTSVVDLSKEIIKGSNNNYEKVEKIKRYLETNYPYSLEVSKVPEGADFIEYFLFQEKKGYCVYFATALTMMSRAVGVPARYVEGFKMPYDSSDKNKFKVTNEDAHGWVEVLLDPKGEIWTTMDPSPTLREVREKEKVENPQQVEEKRKEQDEDKKDKDLELEKEEKQEEDKDEKKEEVKKSRDIDYNLIFTLILIGIFSYISFKALRNIYKIRILKLKGNGKTLYSYGEKRLKSIGIVRNSYDTDVEFVNSIEDKELLEEMMKILMKAQMEIYGDTTSKIKGEEFIDFIEKYIRSRSNFLNYILYKYLI
ncbi:transglutaminase-like domain-containing protein [Clostridium sp.]|uniref:transglutaminase-like domain-containing protein n=1 Tax=Clostridium sp. TaxID=1506 RepID=UPI003464D13C